MMILFRLAEASTVFFNNQQFAGSELSDNLETVLQFWFHPM